MAVQEAMPTTSPAALNFEGVLPTLFRVLVREIVAPGRDTQGSRSACRPSTREKWAHSAREAP